nr:hypothetical protein [Kofleriaceae bacterium]
MTQLPAQPDEETRERLLDVLADLVLGGGAPALLAEPVAPKGAAFPERWRPSPTGVTLLLRRLAWHAGLGDRAIDLIDDRIGAPVTERRPETRVEFEAARHDSLAFRLRYLGRDDIAGTVAHEMGVAYVASLREREQSPYRAASDGERERSGSEPAAAPIDDAELERGSVATVYLGLGVLAANAAYQQYSGGRWNGPYVALEYDVLRAGYLPMSALAYLLAVQAVVRDARSPTPPAHLAPPQRDEVSAWIAALRGDTAALRARLHVDADAEPQPPREVVAFDDPGEPDEPASQRIAFRWRTNRAGSGFLLGSAVGVALAMFTPTHSLAVPVVELAACVGAGFAAGRRARVIRCSRCQHALTVGPACCPRCKSALRGDIAQLEDRLDAEDALSTADADRAS